MKRIYGIGETVLDIIFKDGQPCTAKPGGSVLNSVVSMGRMELPVSFISEYGLDDAGQLIDKFLNDNGVDTVFVHRFSDGNTSLALAFLNEKKDARYSFYKDLHEKHLDIVFPVIKSDDIVQFGSFYAIWPQIREKFRKFILDARQSGALLIYDPNLRQTHLSELDILKPLIIENMQMASLIRGSDEDFRNIFGVNSADEAWGMVNKYCKCLVYTKNSKSVFVRTPSFSGEFPTQKINPVSTIGAGDNFNAGTITSIYCNNIRKDQLKKLTEKEWSGIITTAIDFATHVCLSYENYISPDFAKEQKLR